MNEASRKLWFETAFLPEGWCRGVALTLDPTGRIAAIDRAVSSEGCEPVHGAAIPGLANLHSHGFQRAMAALAQRRRATGEDFWSWRAVMFRAALTLSPEEIEAATAMAFIEMLEGGFTSVAEFHYLHNDPTGCPYDDRAELASRIVAAASASGIGLTLLPVLYSAAGLGLPPAPEQRRFALDRDGFLALHAACARLLASTMPDAVLGSAPHSLRAAKPEDIAAIAHLLPAGPIHIHAAEQIAEVEASVAALGTRPVAWLLDHAGVDERWCLIHSTQMDAGETAALARSGAVAGLCPVTEADLGDGIFRGTAYAEAGGRFGIGTDSNIAIGAAAELRQLEWSQRLRDRARLAYADPDADDGSTATRLYRAALAGGAQALAQPIGALAAGKWADIVVLDTEASDLAALPEAFWLDDYVFGRIARRIDRVYARGRKVVEAGQHVARTEIATRFRRALRRLADTL